MKTKLLLAILFIATLTNAQITIGFETFTIPATGYYNGQEDYTAVDQEQTFILEEDIANFYLYGTDYSGFFYAHGFVLTNQTDLTTADQTNYSAYVQNAGGANGSSNYSIVYVEGVEKVTFDQDITVNSIQIANSVWAYKFMDGSDGSGHQYSAGDSYKLTITGVLSNGTDGNSIDFYLADFTNGNSIIINDWTNVDLSSLGIVSGLKFSVTATDNYTPYYFCLDNIVYGTSASVHEGIFENKVNLYPNPTTDFISITDINKAMITINDMNGKKIYSNSNCNQTEKIDLSTFSKGIYFAKIQLNNKVAIKKIIKK